MGILFDDGADAVAERGHTGRRSNADQLDRLAQEWGAEPLPSHAGATLFLELLAEENPLRANGLPGYRGRRSTAGSDLSGWEAMGPPPIEYARGGRYDPPGHPVLYLCSSLDVIPLEVPGEGALFAQAYELPTDELDILDVNPSRGSPPDFLDSVFDIAESSCVEGRVGPVDFEFCHLVAHLVQKAGFDGFRVPGVRGARGHWYSNIVIFRPGDSWRRWSRREDGFQKLTGA